jgi:hypothetical protein
MFMTQEDDMIDMTTLTKLERIYERVELVHGKGERRKARFCIMSLVALLAGEGHTDAPVTASPFIRQFAIALNDAMPRHERQRLKPFAPRIMGTNDGQDQQRLQVIREFMLREIIPKLETDLADNHWAPQRLDNDWRTYAAPSAKLPQELILGFVNQTYQGGNSRTLPDMARIGAKLLVMCATSVRSAARAERYWATSIDLLDQLCDVKAAERPATLQAVEIVRAEYTLEHAARVGLIARATEALRARFSSSDSLSSLKSCGYGYGESLSEAPPTSEARRADHLLTD